VPWFTEDAIEFFRELELNNDRAWFEANKKRYETSVKVPLEAFVQRLIDRMGLKITPKDAIFRIHRDVRFSKDKTPYKTHAGAVVSEGGRKSGSASSGLYFHFDGRNLAVASGHYEVSPEQLLKFRRHILANLQEFEKRLKDKAFLKHFGGIAGEKNKVLPAEFKEAAKSQPYLANKQFYYWGESEADELLREDLDDFVLEYYRAAGPMNEFLGRARK
jgi:uncharacterized protein (TIGR02453 family)